MADQPGGNSSTFDAAAILNALRTGTGTPTGDALVPLWKTRPAATSEKPRNRFDAVDQKAEHASAPTMYTGDQAEASFLDMPDSDRAEFVDKAKKVGLLGKSPSAADVASAWAKAVGVAKQYNSQNDRSKWVSPWEALQKLGLSEAAAGGGAYDGFQTNTTVRQYSSSDLATTAEQIMRRELGRAPTSAELKAYTIAVNQASAQNPQTVTTYTDPSGNTSNTTQGGIDPNQVMIDKVRADPQRAAYQAAAVYFPDVMRALGAVVQ